MPTKLTQRLDEMLIAAAKVYAQAQGPSVLVADYSAQLTRQAPPPSDAPALGKITASLLGALEGSGLDEADYQRHLEAKLL